MENQDITQCKQVTNEEAESLKNTVEIHIKFDGKELEYKSNYILGAIVTDVDEQSDRLTTIMIGLGDSGDVQTTLRHIISDAVEIMNKNDAHQFMHWMNDISCIALEAMGCKGKVN